MKQEKQPRCYIVASPNGADKTTFELNDFQPCREF